MKNILIKIKDFFKEVMLFTTSYSLNVFADPLSNEEEEYYINELLKYQYMGVVIQHMRKSKAIACLMQ